MKILSVILFAIFSLISFQTENYYIIKIKGEIYNQTSGAALKQGDAIKASDELKFTQKDAIALVISDTRGRFTLKFPERLEESAGALTVFVKNALISNQQNRLSTRSIAMTNTVSHLNDYLGTNEFNIIGDELLIKLSKKTYPIYQGYDIIATYKINNQEYFKKLSTKDQMMSLSRSMFELPDNQYVSIKDVAVYKLNAATGKKELITNINLNFIDKSELEKEFLTIIEKFNNGQNSNSKIRSLLVNYFSEFYGKTDDAYLNQYTSDLIIDYVKE